MRVMLLGAGGMLAHSLLDVVPEHVDVLPFSRCDLDVADGPLISAAVADQKPDLIINCAAWTRVDAAEDDPDGAHASNAIAPGLIGRAALAANAPVVHFSTDYVFDGSRRLPYGEEDRPNPLGVYGRSKLAGELALASSGARSLIIRTQWLFGPGGRSFPLTMWERATAGRATRVVNDQVGRPTYTVDLARATWRLALRMLTPAGAAAPVGIIHVANNGVASWYDVAAKVFQSARRSELLAPCRSADYPTRAPRPKWSVLATTRFERDVPGGLPDWQQALHRFLADISPKPRL